MRYFPKYPLIIVKYTYFLGQTISNQSQTLTQRSDTSEPSNLDMHLRGPIHYYIPTNVDTGKREKEKRGR